MRNDRAPDLSLVVPTFNERAGLSDLVTALYDVANRSGLALEVIVVVDNSPNGTGGYLVQLKDLYLIRWSTFGRRTVRHEAWSPAEIERAITTQLKTQP